MIHLSFILTEKTQNDTSQFTSEYSLHKLWDLYRIIYLQFKSD